MNMTTLAVSKKVYADISTRIGAALSFAPDSAAEAMRLVDSFLAGENPASSDAGAMLAFNMIKAELERAMARSLRARARAAARKKAIAERRENPSPSPTPPEIRLTRQQRRAQERMQRKKLRQCRRPDNGAPAMGASDRVP